jgi:two-component system cell cycle sensor histidine kinase/response regulator CckA
MARTILVVEDDEPTLTLMASALTKRGHQVFQAKDSNEAELQWGEPGRAFDLLISDIRLPENQDGFALAEKLLETRPDVPVIFVSGDPDCFACPNIRLFGDSPFIPKPFDLHKMVAAVEQVLARSPRG